MCTPTSLPRCSGNDCFTITAARSDHRHWHKTVGAFSKSLAQILPTATNSLKRGCPAGARACRCMHLWRQAAVGRCRPPSISDAVDGTT
jgi:hypothetical protein